MANETVKVPDIGSDDKVEVIEICVSPGDSVAVDDSLVVLESDKASMEVPSPLAGVVESIALNVGDKVGQGDALLVITVAADDKPAANETSQPASKQEDEVDDSSEDSKAKEEPVVTETTQETTEKKSKSVEVPDIGSDDSVDVIEICVAVGDDINEGDSLIVLESDKASMDIPAPFSGQVESIAVKEGDKVKQGALILEMQVAGSASQTRAPAAPPSDNASKASSAAEKQTAPVEEKSTATADKEQSVYKKYHAGDPIYAGPAVRKLAREMGIDLLKVNGSGPRNRVLKDDLKQYVKSVMTGESGGSLGIPAVPDIDFSQFGEIDIQPLTKIAKLTAENMHRSWLNVPHVTQFDDVDITELESFRASLKAEAQQRGTKLTPLAFLLMACAKALLKNPAFNASLLTDGERIAYKKYVHIGIAVDTPAGLVVPVIRDVDQKTIWQLAEESNALAAKAKERKLGPKDMQGGCFTISSLGNIGGTGFTPIVNTPEVGILGVSKMTVKPIWNGNKFEPRKMLPLSLSYDHRAINGAVAGRFMTDLNEIMLDLRRALL